MVSFSFALYVRKVLLPTTSVFLLTSSISVGLFCVIPDNGILKTVEVIAMILIFTALVILFVGVSTTERMFICNRVGNLIHKNND